jgi:hypothetical protein
MRVIEQAKVARATGTYPTTDPKRTSQTAPAVPTLPTAPAATPPPARVSMPPELSNSRQTIQTKTVTSAIRQTLETTAIRRLLDPSLHLSRRERQGLIAAIAGVLLLAILSVVIWTVVNQTPHSNVPTYKALPPASADQVVSYLKQVGEFVSNVRPLSKPEIPWRAQQEVKFDIKSGADSGQVTLLVYKASYDQSLDYGTLLLDPYYKNMWFVEKTNLLVLMPKDSSALLQADLRSHLTSLLEAPYRTYLPTPTPGAATATATVPAPTAKPK